MEDLFSQKSDFRVVRLSEADARAGSDNLYCVFRITYIALRLADSAYQKKENTKIHIKKIQATLEITGFEEPSQSGCYLRDKFLILLALPSLLAEKQPDISTGRPLFAIEVANEDVEFAVFVPICYVDSTSVAFAEVISGQAYLFACL